ncbi:MAG: hypothetical protein AB7S26_14680 [Sandaracinaceae bacterium]
MRFHGLSKALLGVFTAWPPVYVVFFFIYMLTSFQTFDMDGFQVVFVVHAMTAVLTLILLGIYVLHALLNPKLAPVERLLWALMMFVGGLIAMPIYFVLKILPAEPVDPEAELADPAPTTF